MVVYAMVENKLKTSNKIPGGTTHKDTEPEVKQMNIICHLISRRSGFLELIQICEEFCLSLITLLMPILIVAGAMGSMWILILATLPSPG